VKNLQTMQNKADKIIGGGIFILTMHILIFTKF